MSTDTQHLVYHRSRVSDLEHELALARASSDYWRTKYIENKPSKEVNEYRNALRWFQLMSIRDGII